MKLTSKGQITIPQALRERFEAWVRKARGSATVKLSTDEIMHLTRGEP